MSVISSVELLDYGTSRLQYGVALGYAYGRYDQGDRRLDVEDASAFAQAVEQSGDTTELKRKYEAFADELAAKIDAAQQAYEVAS